MAKYLRGSSVFYSPTISTRNKKPSTKPLPQVVRTNDENAVTKENDDSCLDEIVIQEIASCRCDPSLKQSRKAIKTLERELKLTRAHMQKTEVSKLELANRCNTLEANVASAIRVREKYKKMSDERAHVEVEFMNQLNELSITMRRQELEHERQLREKDETIAFLQSKLSNLKSDNYNNLMSPTATARINHEPETERGSGDERNSDSSSSVGSNSANGLIGKEHFGGYGDGNDDDDDNNERDTFCNNSTHTYNDLTSDLNESRIKNVCLSREIQELHSVVDDLEERATRLPEVERQLQESYQLLQAYKRANSLLSTIDDDQEDKLRHQFQGANLEEEQFMNQLESLELDMSLDLKDLEFELMTSSGEAHEI